MFYNIHYWSLFLYSSILPKYFYLSTNVMGGQNQIPDGGGDNLRLSSLVGIVLVHRIPICVRAMAQCYSIINIPFTTPNK